MRYAVAVVVAALAVIVGCAELARSGWSDDWPRRLAAVIDGEPGASIPGTTPEAPGLACTADGRLIVAVDARGEFMVSRAATGTANPGRWNASSSMRC